MPARDAIVHLVLPDRAGDRSHGQRVEAVITQLGLSHARQQAVSTLSGGERKRANLAAEMIVAPSVLFLDEPAAGLDPGTQSWRIRAVDKNATLLRATVATAGNDHRLGANEAPPAIISVFLGKQLADIFADLEAGLESTSTEAEHIEIGVSVLVIPYRHPLLTAKMLATADQLSQG